MAPQHDAGHESPPPTTIKSVSTMFRVVESLRELDHTGITDISEHTGLAKSTVHKHLSTLLEEDFVVKDEDSYELGGRFLDLGGYYRESRFGFGQVKERIRNLAEETGHVAHFAVPEHGRAIILYREGGDLDVPTRSRVGKRMYLHQTAYGKAILAHLPEQRVEEIVSDWNLPPATEHTITDIESLFEELDEVRERGYAVNDEESTKGLRAVGAPILYEDGSVFGAISIAGPEMRIDEELEALMRSTRQLEFEIRYS